MKKINNKCIFIFREKLWIRDLAMYIYNSPETSEMSGILCNDIKKLVLAFIFKQLLN